VTVVLFVDARLARLALLARLAFLVLLLLAQRKLYGTGDKKQRQD
jgi:hypothetical protein